MTDDLVAPAIPPGAHTVEHDLDPADMADAYVILDGTDVRLATCDGCGMTACRCCRTCDTWPCRCGPPFTQREYRDMAARWAGAPERVR